MTSCAIARIPFLCCQLVAESADTGAAAFSGIGCAGEMGGSTICVAPWVDVIRRGPKLWAVGVGS